MCVVNTTIFCQTSPDSLLIDSLYTNQDTIFPTSTDTTIVPEIAEKKKIGFSEDSFDAPIEYGATDSMRFDNSKNEVHLWGSAFVHYEQMKLTAGYIIFNFESDIAEAFTTRDKNGRRLEQPTFDDGSKQLKYRELKYNFKTEKGIVYDAITQEGELYLHGARTKYISKGVDSTLQEEKILYNKNALITSCNHEHPHFGIRTSKLKVVPDKIAVVGPAQLEIAGIPTPVVLPFGFFPLAEGESSGFLFPNDYEYSESLGFGFRGMGWYFPISDYMDLTLRTDFYTRGTWGLNLTSAYKKRYKYNGSVNLSFNDNRTENLTDGSYDSNKSFRIALRHNQDAKAHPYRSIGGTINFEKNNYSRTVNNDANSATRNVIRSNFNFTHSMPNTPFNFTAGLSHSQNTNTNEVDLTLPDITLAMRTIYPFKNKNRGGNEEKWFENISFRYDTQLQNFVASTDSTIFTNAVFDDLRTGMNHNMSTAMSFRALKHFSVSPSISYNEKWFTRRETREYFSENDSIAEGFENAFNTFRTYNVGISATTQVFGTMLFNRGKIKGIRHTLKPRFGFNFTPETRDRYIQVLQAGEDDPIEYSPFPNQPFSTSLGNKAMNFNYGFGNNLEVKYFSKKDSTDKIFKVFDRLDVSGSHNFIADSLKWSTVGLSASSRLFKNITTITVRMTFDPYMENESGRRINTPVLSEQGKLLRTDFGSFKLTNRMAFSKIRDLFLKKHDDHTKGGGRGSDSRDRPSGDRNDIDAYIPNDSSSDIVQNRNFSDQEEGELGPDRQPAFTSLFDKLNIVHDFEWRYATQGEQDSSFVFNHSISMSGTINLTENWTIAVGNIGYDFVNKGLNYPRFTFRRKLHCWNMDFSWTPNRDTYSFFIGVSGGAFNFLKYNYGQNNIDGLFR
jgi:hypothetical protein